ncbi:nucleotide modification associated domain-containing protein [Lysinibacillus xylanilyticus]|uniref:nucleotide modification associated domain-containing protein n=1 Tax=Lysinibacillus xylanilyticus TaxID=582475 RepID=UPI003D0260D4
MAKAQKGDLIRVVKHSGIGRYKIGDIFEVSERHGANTRSEPGVYVIEHPIYIYDWEYEIHRKAGEEDDVQSTQLEPSKWSDTQENLIRLACSELADLLVRKNHDYGDSFSQQYGKYGLMSALIRMDDKMRRLETLQGGEQAQVAESVGDTLQDLAGYALLAYIESKKK